MIRTFRRAPHATARRAFRAPTRLRVGPGRRNRRARAARRDPRVASTSNFFVTRDPICLARLARAAARCMPSRRAAARTSSLSPPSWPLRSATSHRGVARRRAATPSSRNGNRASRPRSLTSRSSLPMFRRHRRVASRRTASPSASQSRAGERPSAGPSSFANARMASPDDTPARNAARWREYPAHCSSAPCPSRSARARDALRDPDAVGGGGGARRAARAVRRTVWAAVRRRRRRDIDPAFPLAASHSASRCCGPSPCAPGATGPRAARRKTPPNLVDVRVDARSTARRAPGRGASSSAAPSSAAARSGRPPSKHTLMSPRRAPRHVPVRQRREQHAVHPPENKTPMNARPSGGSEVPFPRGASATLARRGARRRRRRRHEPIHRGVARGVRRSPPCRCPPSRRARTRPRSTRARPPGASRRARGGTGAGARRARRFFFFSRRGRTRRFLFPPRARPRNTARARAPPIRLFRGLGFPARRTTGRVPSREARRRVARRRRGRARRRAGGAGCAGRRRRARTTGAWTPRASTQEPTGLAGRRARMRRGLHRLEPARRPRRTPRAAPRRRSRRRRRLRRRRRRSPPKTRGRFLGRPRGGRRSGCCRGAGAGSRGCGSPSEALRPGAGARGGGRRRVCAKPLRHRVPSCG